MLEGGILRGSEITAVSEQMENMYVFELLIIVCSVLNIHHTLCCVVSSYQVDCKDVTRQQMMQSSITGRHDTAFAEIASTTKYNRKTVGIKY
jgi:hypothetical protein